MVNIFNPEVVVVGGGVIGAGELLLGPAREVVAARALPPMRDAVRIEPSAVRRRSRECWARRCWRLALGTR